MCFSCMVSTDISGEMATNTRENGSRAWCTAKGSSNASPVSLRLASVLNATALSVLFWSSSGLLFLSVFSCFTYLWSNYWNSFIVCQRNTQHQRSFLPSHLLSLLLSFYRCFLLASLQDDEGNDMVNQSETYQGAYVENKPHGLGTYTWSDGKSMQVVLLCLVTRVSMVCEFFFLFFLLIMISGVPTIPLSLSFFSLFSFSTCLVLVFRKGGCLRGSGTKALFKAKGSSGGRMGRNTK